ncbi:unnamed protein product [Rotaria sordida]|uniref:C2 domain-containing protein n=1 Tax=Rotaria sordida TaxID=392033 RepID=A0A813RZK1_9BILA|nr:unnamed protein product [Rotaria sordida]CAF3561127.1 unnamed protein product [Rotaria sordida]
MITTMILSMIFLHPYNFAVIVSIILLVTLICIFLYVHRLYNKKRSETVIIEKHLLYSSPTSITPNRFIFPLSKLPNTDKIETNTESTPKITRNILTQCSINEISPNYRTFDLTKQASSDSSEESSIHRHSQPPSFSFGKIKSKFQQVHSTSSPISSYPQGNINSEERSIVSSDSDDIDNEILASEISSFEYSLVELFRIELIYKLYYLINNNQLVFQIVRLTPMQSLIEQCFPSLLCKIRLFTDNDKHKNKKYSSKKDPINDLFKFDLEQFDLEKSYLKLHILGYDKNGKHFELGQTVLVINQHNQVMIRSENHNYDEDLIMSKQYTKSIQIYEDRIDMIIRQQTKVANEARALICLVYESDRCLLHVGVIKIHGIQYLFKQSTNHFHHRDQIQIQICTIVDEKITGKRKSKLIPITKGICTFSTSFHFDYVSLHKTLIRITIFYRRSLISTHGKPISMIEFGSTQLKNQQTFQHWTDTLSSPNRPHVHWHILELIHTINEK